MRRIPVLSYEAQPFLGIVTKNQSTADTCEMSVAAAGGGMEFNRWGLVAAHYVSFIRDARGGRDQAVCHPSRTLMTAGPASRDRLD